MTRTITSTFPGKHGPCRLFSACAHIRTKLHSALRSLELTRVALQSGMGCLRPFLIVEAKYSTPTTQRKRGLFWLTASVHGPLAPGGEAWQRKLRKQKTETLENREIRAQEGDTSFQAVVPGTQSNPISHLRSQL